MTTKEPKTPLGNEIKQILFTTSSDISDSVILNFDLKSKEMTIAEYQTGECRSETLDIRVGDLFEHGAHPENSMFASRLRFHHGNFKRLVQQILGFIDSAQVKITDNTLAIEVKTDHFGSVYGMSGDLRTLTHCEFASLLAGLLNVAWFKLFRAFLLVQESRNDPGWDDVPTDERPVNRPSGVFTVIRQDNNGIADVRTFSTWTTALQDAQALVDEVCRGYPDGWIPDEERVFDEEECCWQTPDGLNHVFLYETELRDE